MLASALKRPELPVFYLLFWPCLNSRQKIPTATWFRSAPLHPAVWFFRFFPLLDFHPLLVFPPRHRPGGFFYQSLRSFSFPLPGPQGVGGFLLIDPLVFLHHLPSGFWRFFTHSNIYLHARWSSHPRGEAILMIWSPDLVTCLVTWHGAQPHPSIYKVM